MRGGRARDELWDMAVDQYGFVSIRDALAAGFSRATINSLVQRGTLERVAFGVYRFPELPVTEYDSYMRALLWTGDPDACLSHDTALACYELADINPIEIHMTVPPGHRIRRTSSHYRLHHHRLPERARTWWRRLPIVTPSVAIEQCIEGDVPTYLLRQALSEGMRQGLLSDAEVRELERRLEHHGRG